VSPTLDGARQRAVALEAGAARTGRRRDGVAAVTVSVSISSAGVGGPRDARVEQRAPDAAAARSARTIMPIRWPMWRTLTRVSRSQLIAPHEPLADPRAERERARRADRAERAT
jgi:hypothetical protein